MQTTSKRLAMLAAAVTVLAAGAALALDKPAGFPERPITIIVPYGAGGGSDQLSRAMAKAIRKAAGVSFQVVNNRELQ